ncbi:MAG: M28 family peptidase [Acidobacteria bacterium]|nr:M28 family peptidase [Acidobacteriota bacterium]
MRLSILLVGAIGLGWAPLSAGAQETVFTAETGPLPGLVDDATRLDQASAEARFDALIGLLEARGLSYEVQTFPNRRVAESGPAQGRNVSVLIGTGAEEIVVGAHADAAQLGDGSFSHAMVDNAASVAVLVRIAATLPRFAIRHRVRVVFFDLEELNLLGSEYMVTTLDADRVAAMINLDIAGYGDTVIYGPAAGPGNGAVYRAVAQACADGGHPCLEFDQFPQGDDRSFQAAGIPNVSLGILTSVEAHQLWLMLNGGPNSGLAERFVPPILRTIHTQADTADRLDPEGMTLAYNIVMALILELDRPTP